MALYCRRSLDGDYDAICSWWVDHGWAPVPSYLLPDGWIVEDETGVAKCAGFLYRDSTAPVGMMEWVVSNPENTPMGSYKALSLLISEVLKNATASGCRIVYSKLVHEGLERLYNKHGFITGDTSVKDMSWINGE